MKLQVRLIAIAMLVALAAPTQTAPAASNRAVVPGQALITRLIFDYTPAATKQTGDDDKFNAGLLRKAVVDGLAAQGLLDVEKAEVIRVAAIEIDEFDVRATSNIVLMGRVASAGVLGATVRIRDGSSKELQQFHVRAEVALRIVSNGRNKNPLQNLYKEFAGEIADALTGKVRQPPAPRQ